jgi:septum formation protein
MWIDNTVTLFIASASPRRLELLQQIKIPTQQLTIPTPDGEDEPRHDNESVIEYVTRTTDDKLQRALAHLKIEAVGQPSWQTPLQRNNPSHQKTDATSLAVMTADTTVALGQDILSKPLDSHDAVRMLTLLSDTTHDVYTAVDLYYAGQIYRALSHSKVTFTNLSLSQIEQYVTTQEPFGKAGAYAIQGIAAQYVERLEGSFSGVMGLPLFETAQLLRKAGLFQ